MTTIEHNEQLIETPLQVESNHYLEIQETGSALIQRAESFSVIKNDSDNLQAAEVLNELKKKQKAAKEERDSIVKPIDAAKKAADKLYKQVVEPLERAEKFIDGLMGQYYLAREVERQRLQAIEDEKLRKKNETYQKKVEKAEAKGIEPPPPPAPVIVQGAEKTIKSETGTSSTVIVEWKAEIVHEDLVPRQYCIPHMPKINAAVKSGMREIPGVRITQQTRVQTRTA